MPWGRVLGIATAVVAVVWLATDARMLADVPPPEALSWALGALALVFGAGAAVMWYGGQPERAPNPAGLALGLLVYAVGRLFLR